MAKPKSKGTSAFVPTQFVTCNLTPDEKKFFPDWRKKNADLMDDLMIEIMQTNHKVAFSFNGQTDSFIVSVTGKPEDCNNASKCYTSHGQDYLTALWVALFKFHHIWKRGVWEEVDDAADFG